MRFAMICLWMLLTLGVHANERFEDAPMASKGDLRFFADVACFRGPDQRTRLEVYVLLDARQLAFVPEGNRFVGQCDLALRAVDETHQVIETASWTRNLTLDRQAHAKGGQALHRDRVWIDLPPGRYHMSVEIEDMYGDRTGVGQRWVAVHNFEQDALVLSDVLCAKSLEAGAGSGRFARYDWQVVPNVTRRYPVGDPVPLFVEFYHLTTGSEQNNFVIGYSFRDSTGRSVKTYSPRRFQTPGVSAVNTRVLETEGVPAGVYWLYVEAFDQAGRHHAQRTRRVVMADPEGPPPELSDTEAAHLRYYKDIRHVASPRELKQYERLKDQAQMNFLRKFWQQQDPTPQTPVNERLIAHIQRMEYVETNFSVGNALSAADTDRGRVYVKYGAPDEVERSLSSDDKSSEIWHYKQYIFIFRDPNGLGVYRLMHSTYPGELYNPDWEMQTY